MTRTVTLLGSTGSIGTQAVKVLRAHAERFRVHALAAGSNVEGLAAQARAVQPDVVAVADRDAAPALRAALPATIAVEAGPEAVVAVAGGGADVVLNAIVGSRGLPATLAALHAGSRLALANKESLIVGGALVLDALQTPDQLVPVDSEHSAIAQCLRAGAPREVARLILTASGGPFHGRSRAALTHVTVEDALAHPTWSMGPLITVNSATLANKGLEVIEAHLLFGLPFERLAVVVHPQSVVHGMVEFCDGATIAKLSPPDMRLPIQLALAWPERLDEAPARMDWTQRLALEFEPVDAETFPMLDLLVTAGRRGGTYPGVANAANEEAVAGFLAHRLRFLDIPAVVEAVLEAHDPPASLDLDGVLAAERWARRYANTVIDRRTGQSTACT